MPTLECRRDGCYFIRHFYREFSTWQVTAEGVRYLQRRGVPEGGYFPTDDFMHLLRNRWVSIGEHPLELGHSGIGDLMDPRNLRDAVHQFHTALKKGDRLAASQFIVDDLSDETWSKSLLTSWKPEDSFTCPVENAEVDGEPVEAIGKAHLALLFRGEQAKVYLTEYWLRTKSGWSVMWEGPPSPSAQVQ